MYATNPEVLAISWDVSGPDSGKFEISALGALTFEAQPNFEPPGDSNGDNVYEVTVVASDPAKNSDELDVRVTVTNVAETGTITFSSRQPKVGAALTATFADADGSITGFKWQWSSSDTDTNRTDAFEDETSDTYTPVADDVNDTLTVTATYRDGSLMADAEVITLAVAHAALVAPDTDNKAPRFLVDDEVVTSVERMVAENTVAGEVIGEPVGALDPAPAGSGLTADVLTYTLGGVDAASFDIVSSSGQLQTTKADLDYETKDTYTVTVTATDPGGLSATVTVTIEVMPVNEVPEIDGEAPAEYAENGRTPVATFTASDPERATIIWTLTGGDAEDFTIVGGVLRFKEAPNFEARAGSGTGGNTYVITVNASDGTNSDTEDVEIQVTNVDEPGVVTLSTLQPQVGVVLTATLRDSDVVRNGTPTWQWFRGSSAIVDATNAEYTPVTGDAGSRLKAKVTYRDGEDTENDKTAEGSSAPRSVRSVPTSGNILPVFPTQGDDTTDQTREVAENTPSGRSIGAPVVASDTGDVLTYSIDGDSDAIFDIDRATGQLKTQGPLNADGGTASYTVTVTAEDPFKSMAMAVVTITVTDVDEDPSISTTGEAFTAISFAEDDAITTVLGDHAATDPEDLTISWDVSGPDSGKFEISALGALTFEAQPNFEPPGDSNGDNVYEVTVVASDPAKNSDELDVRVTVTNVPELGTITFSSLKPKVGAALTATFADADGSITDFKWQWSSSDTDTNRTDAFEDETSDTYTPVADDVNDTLTVTATYRDGSLMADAEVITLAVAHAANVAADTDNKAPRFLVDDEVVTSVERTIAEDTEPDSDSRVIDPPVGAVDPEVASGLTEILTYTLGGVDAASFAIDGGTGQLSTKADLDYETKDTYTVTVTATDPGGLSATVTVTIMVTNVDEAPEIMVRRAGHIR